MMQKKRTLRIGTYSTASYGWTLTGLKLSDPEQKTSYVERIGGDGSHDLSTAMTDGIPRYKVRTLTATLELSEGDRNDREAVLNHLVDTLDGFVWQIVLPDRPEHYLSGRVHIAVTQSSPAYAAVTVTAVCEPWFYAKREKVISVTPIVDMEQTVQIRNTGRLAVVPTLISTGAVTLTYNNVTIEIGAGETVWPSLLLTPGVHTLTFIGEGVLTISFREGVLR